MHAIYEIAVAGGPAAGKSTILPILQREMESLGWRVLVMPEMASWLYTHGVHDIADLAAHKRDAYLAVQETLGMWMWDFRKRIRPLAHALRQPCIILTDRGELDLGVYLERSECQEILGRNDLTWQDLIDSYHGVLYLETGADYLGTLTENAARRETDLEAAKSADKLTRSVWSEHPNFHLVSANPDFGRKVSEAIHTLKEMIGEA